MKANVESGRVVGSVRGVRLAAVLNEVGSVAVVASAR
jgi:hypothetical protein